MAAILLFVKVSSFFFGLMLLPHNTSNDQLIMVENCLFPRNVDSTVCCARLMNGCFKVNACTPSRVYNEVIDARILSLDSRFHSMEYMAHSSLENRDRKNKTERSPIDGIEAQEVLKELRYPLGTSWDTVAHLSPTRFSVADPCKPKDQTRAGSQLDRGAVQSAEQPETD